MNINAIDLNLLVAFEALWEERHVSRAAVRIGLSQPAMSNALRRLRALFDDVLFVRGSRGITPTARAAQIADSVRTGLSHIRVAVSERAAFDPGTTVRTFRIAMNDYAELRLAGRLARQLEALAPGVRIVVRRSERLFVSPEEELRTGAVDAAIGFFADTSAADPAMRVHDLFTEKNVVITRSGHPILRRRLTPAALASAEHVAVFLKNEPRGLIDSVLASQNLERRLKVRTPHFLSVPHIVAASDLIACVPAGLAQAYARWLQLAVRPIPIQIPPFTMRLVWHDRTADDPAQRWFQGMLSRSATAATDSNAPF